MLSCVKVFSYKMCDCPSSKMDPDKKKFSEELNGSQGEVSAYLMIVNVPKWFLHDMRLLFFFLFHFSCFYSESAFLTCRCHSAQFIHSSYDTATLPIRKGSLY